MTDVEIDLAPVIVELDLEPALIDLEVSEAPVEVELDLTPIEVSTEPDTAYPVAVVQQPTSSGRLITPDGRYADQRTTNGIVGFTLNAALTNERVAYATDGPLYNDTWNWDVTKPIFLGQDGFPTQVQPTSGWSMIVAYPTTPRSIYIHKEAAVWLTSS